MPSIRYDTKKKVSYTCFSTVEPALPKFLPPPVNFKEVPSFVMLNTIAKWIYAHLRGLFFCGCCNPELSNPIPDLDIAGRNSQDTHLINPSDVALETPKAPMSEKCSHSVSNDSAGNQSGMAPASQDTAAQGMRPNGTDQLPVRQDNVMQVWTRIPSAHLTELAIQPDTPSSEMDMLNRSTHQEMLAQHPQLVSGLPGVNGVESTIPPSIVEGSDETLDSQNPAVPQQVWA